MKNYIIESEKLNPEITIMYFALFRIREIKSHLEGMIKKQNDFNVDI